MSGVNRVIILGRLGNDPDVKQFGNGGSVTNISVATSEKWTDKQTGEKKEVTEWHRIVMFNKLGEIAAKYLRKGSQVYIEGKLQTRKWKDQSGQDRHTTEVRADSMQMLDSKNEGQPPNQNYQQQQPQQQQYQQQPPQQQQYQQQPQQYQQQPQQQPQQYQQPQQLNNQMNNPQVADTPKDDDIPF